MRGDADAHDRLTDGDQHEQPEALGEVDRVEAHRSQAAAQQRRRRQVDQRGERPHGEASIAVQEGAGEQERPRDDHAEGERVERPVAAEQHDAQHHARRPVREREQDAAVVYASGTASAMNMPPSATANTTIRMSGVVRSCTSACTVTPTHTQ